ncbi:hypothetical protein LBMAG16_09600 [Actinomycetes bacterium]|nr:hypothetical protein LBMAG16_09600 [Actinomycetes bacterium]
MQAVNKSKLTAKVLQLRAVIKNLAWVTTLAAHGRDEDESAVVAALRVTGCEVEIVNWDDKSVNWSQFNPVVLRSAWDYLCQS